MCAWESLFLGGKYNYKIHAYAAKGMTETRSLKACQFFLLAFYVQFYSTILLIPLQIFAETQ
jgi:hypothetical protein